MTRRIWFATLLVVVFATSALVGCGESKPKVYPVNGTVTLDGKPLAEGTVFFKTIQTGALESFDVMDGEFKGKAEAGDRRVEICLFRTKTMDLNGMTGEVRENVIPKRYNLESKLTALVASEDANQFKFEITSK